MIPHFLQGERGGGSEAKRVATSEASRNERSESQRAKRVATSEASRAKIGDATSEASRAKIGNATSEAKRSEAKRRLALANLMRITMMIVKILASSTQLL